MTNLHTCAWCKRPLQDQAVICPTCTEPAARGLRRVANLAGEAATTIARLDQLGETATGPHEPPEPEARSTNALTSTALPVNLGAGAGHDAGVGVLLTWARHVAGVKGVPLPTVRRTPCVHPTCLARRAGRAAGPLCAGEPLEHPVTVLADWLGGQLRWLRQRPEAGEALSEIQDACIAMERVVDRAPERWFAGVCGATTMAGQCPKTLWPAAGAKTIRCVCGAEHDADERKQKLLDEAEDRWVTASWSAHLLTSLGVSCTPEMVRGYAHRGRLAPHPVPDGKSPRYRFGSVRELVEQQHAAERERTLRAAVRQAELAERRSQKAKRDQEAMSP